MRVEIFINEKSFEGQYPNDNKLLEGINEFIKVMQCVREIKADSRELYYNEIFYSLSLLKDSRFDTSIKKNPDLNRRFFENFQQAGAKRWRETQVHTSANTYTCLVGDCNDSSIAEVAERSLRTSTYNGYCINFTDSRFGNSSRLEVVKDSNINTPIKVASGADFYLLQQWLLSIGYILPNVRKFEHHKKKHDRARPTSGNSTLLCNDEEAQNFLDLATYEYTPFDSRLYSHDTARRKVIVFNQHTPFCYHGYHQDDNTNIPANVLRTFGL